MSRSGARSRVLVVSPHPDDESIGCGGSLRLHAEAGDRVDVLFLTSGEAGGHGLAPRHAARVREREAERAAGVLGVAGLSFWREPDGGVRATAALVARLGREMERARPDLVYVSDARDMHRDHRAAARAVARAVRGLRGAPRPRLLGFEVWTPLERFDEVVDVTTVIRVKRAAIRCYRSQCRVLAFDDAMVGLARYRGEMHCWPEGEYAEVFRRVRP